MDFSSSNEVLGIAKDLNRQREQFMNGLLTLAEHWNGEEGVRQVKNMITDAVQKGASAEVAAVEAYNFIKSQIF